MSQSRPLAASTIALLARPFEGGSGPSHSVIELVWTSADAEAYLGEGNKLERVLNGLRSLQDGRSARDGHPALPADHDKLRTVAYDLGTRLLALGLVDSEQVGEALGNARSAQPPPSDPAPPAVSQSEPRAPRLGNSTVEGKAPTVGTIASAEDPAAVMVVHGRDEQAKRAMFDWLRSIGLRPLEWNQLVSRSRDASPFIGEILEAAFRRAQAVVVLFTPDERAQLRPGHDDDSAPWRLQARPNVLFEAGMAFATHPQRTVLAVLGEQDMPSDLAGRNYVSLSSVGGLRDLAERLEHAGCPVDLSGSEWLDITRFPARSNIAVGPPTQAESSSTHILSHFTALREPLLRAFSDGTVDLDIAAYSGETFYSVLSEFLQDVLDGRLPLRRLHIRLLLPDCAAPMAVPCDVDTLDEVPAYKQTIEERNRRFVGEFRGYFLQIAQRQLVDDASFDVHLHRLSPLFKTVIINNNLMFLGFYPIAQTPVTLDGHDIRMWDYRGERVHMLGASAAGSKMEHEQFMAIRRWFDSVWAHMAPPLTSGSKEEASE